MSMSGEPTITDEDVAAIRSALSTQGYAVLPGFFSTEEIARMRATVQGFFAGGRGVVFNLGKTQPNAAIECHDLKWVFADPKVTDLFKRILADRGTVFTGHCDLHSSIVSSWHRDTGGPGHPYFDEECFVEDCQVYKMAIYLQSHEEDGQGLTVRPGSHLVDEDSANEEISLKSGVGDVVIFDVRISHRGRMPNAVERFLQRAGRATTRIVQKVTGVSVKGQPAWTLRAREVMDTLSGTQAKLSIFFTFGADNRFTTQFARANMDRQRSQYAEGGSVYPEGLVEALHTAAIGVHEPEPECSPTGIAGC